MAIRPWSPENVTQIPLGSSAHGKFWAMGFAKIVGDVECFLCLTFREQAR
jgi:hypothetical protein